MTHRVVRALQGDDPPSAHLYYGVGVLEGLRGLPEHSVHAICTSPPYWGLRSYGAEPAVWGGDTSCDHEWVATDEGYTGHRSSYQVPQTKWASNQTYPDPEDQGQGFAECFKCGAWQGHLGLEETPELFVEHLVQVFREAKRVLRPDGTLWLNLGDSYASTGPGNARPDHSGGVSLPTRGEQGASKACHVPRPSTIVSGFKPKDMVGIPWRVAFALQADGWYFRSACPWIKRNCLPESVRDRPTSGLEYVFLFAHPDSKGKYFYDIDAIKRPHGFNRWSRNRSKDDPVVDACYNGQVGKSSLLREGQDLNLFPEGGRNLRNTDWFYDSVEAIAQGEQAVVLDEEGAPMAFGVNPKGYPGAHFAVFPPALVEPMVKASTSERGVCPKCGAPWTRVLGERRATPGRGSGVVNPKDNHQPEGRSGRRTSFPWNPTTQDTSAWEPTCQCADHVPVRAVVLDPFSGSGTTGMVALELHRDYVGIDLNDEYLELATNRILNEAPPPAEYDEDEPGSVLDLFGEE